MITVQKSLMAVALVTSTNAFAVAPLYLTEASVRESLLSSWSLLEACDEGGDRGEADGTPWPISFTIERDGATTNIAFQLEGEPPGATVRGCLVERLSAHRFSAHFEEPLSMEYTFVWTASGLLPYPRIPTPQYESTPLGLILPGVTRHELIELLGPSSEEP